MSDVDVVERSCGQKTDTANSEQKIVVTIIWNLSGFYVVDRLLTDTKMNGDYFVTNILFPLEEAIFTHGRMPHERSHVIHLDNCSIHTSSSSTD
jgi:hypothetical protein